MKQRAYLTISDVAAQLGVHPNTVRNWVRNGWIKYRWWMTGKRLQRVFSQTALDRFRREAAAGKYPMRERKAPVGPPLQQILEDLLDAFNKDKPKKGDARKLYDALKQHVRAK